jgi:hypothetical protein
MDANEGHRTHGLAHDGVDVGTAYRALPEFEAQGLVESAWARGISGREPCNR